MDRRHELTRATLAGVAFGRDEAEQTGRVLCGDGDAMDGTEYAQRGHIDGVPVRVVWMFDEDEIGEASDECGVLDDESDLPWDRAPDMIEIDMAACDRLGVTEAMIDTLRRKLG